MPKCLSKWNEKKKNTFTQKPIYLNREKDVDAYTMVNPYNGISLSNRKKLLTHATTRVNYKRIVRERSQT